MSKFEKLLEDLYGSLLPEKAEPKSAVDHVLKRAANYEEKPMGLNKAMDTGGRKAKSQAGKIDKAMSKIASAELATLKQVHKQQKKAAADVGKQSYT